MSAIFSEVDTCTNYVMAAVLPHYVVDEGASRDGYSVVHWALTITIIVINSCSIVSKIVFKDAVCYCKIVTVYCLMNNVKSRVDTVMGKRAPCYSYMIWGHAIRRYVYIHCICNTLLKPRVFNCKVFHIANFDIMRLDI